MARTFVGLGYVTVRLNFRGVGKTEGTHDNGIGEQDDVLAVLDWMRTQTEWSADVATLPLALGGFSFGSFVISQVARRLAEAGTPAERLALVGTATSRWDVAPVPAGTIIIHGEQDDTVPLIDVLNWARPQELPVIVIPGADHFFHRKLKVIRSIIVGPDDLPPPDTFTAEGLPWDRTLLELSAGRPDCGYNYARSTSFSLPKILPDFKSNLTPDRSIRRL